MTNTLTKRIQKELKDFFSIEEAVQGVIKLELVNDDCSELRGEIAGPPDTPYAGGKFVLKIKIPPNYPFVPPIIRFLTKIWHPNVSSTTGAICSRSKADQWSPVMTFRCILLSIQAMLSTAKPDEPQDVVVAKQFIENPGMFRLTARHWTNVYAGGPTKYQILDDMVKQLTDMGLDEMQSRAALSSWGWDTIGALNKLLLK